MRAFVALLLTLTLAFGAIAQRVTPRPRYDRRERERERQRELQRERERERARNDCDFRGEWRNKAGSTMSISRVEGDGTLSGYFTSALPLTGTSRGTRTDRRSQAQVRGQFRGDRWGRMVTFRVKWDSGTVATWVGQCFPDSCDGSDEIKATWVLLDRSDNPHQYYANNRIGQDVFIKHSNTGSWWQPARSQRG